jgi:hypothetical protein
VIDASARLRDTLEGLPVVSRAGVTADGSRCSRVADSDDDEPPAEYSRLPRRTTTDKTVCPAGGA